MRNLTTSNSDIPVEVRCVNSFHYIRSFYEGNSAFTTTLFWKQVNYNIENTVSTDHRVFITTVYTV